jgi:hypothetical protein
MAKANLSELPRTIGMEIDEWMNGDRRIAWLRSQSYAK